MNEDFHRIYNTLATLEQQVAEQKQQIEELTEKQEQAQAKLDRASKLTFSNADAISKIIPSINELDRRTLELHYRDFSINRRLNRVCRAHNRHVLSTVEPRKQAPGWARNKARDRRTWAKPKGWRL